MVPDEINPEDDFLKNPLQSRRFWIAVFTALLNAVVAVYPPLADVREQLIQIFSLLGVTLIAGFSLTHALDRIESVLKSRRFWIAIGTGFVNLVVLFWEPFGQVRTEVVDLITYIGMALIGGLTLTDIALLKGWTKKL
jgi:hypothetical protein